MNNLSAEIIVVLYTKYQMLNYWMRFGGVLMPVFGVLTVILLFIFLGFLADDNIFSIPMLFTDIIFFILCIIGVCLFAYNKYQIEVVLKPEIAKHIVPMGLDVADKVTSEISEMWSILKGLLSK